MTKPDDEGMCGVKKRNAGSTGVSRMSLASLRNLEMQALPDFIIYQIR
ncbi:MAG: hypothetical protein ABIP71_13625 [Verrucomicrobiota bacterium]